MIEQGTLKDITAAELLLKGYFEELTGVLYLKREEILKELYMKNGKLVWAVSNSDVDTIENVLVSENKVDAQTISLLKSESENMIDLGKSLVEKGIISFEEFVGYSKSQLDKILTSVLKWGDGVYYFSKDVPAETYISLEIDLNEYVQNFIKNNLDMGFVWTKIGSLHEELQKTGDDSLIEKFDLSHEELELLDKFSGDLSIEMISLNFPGMAKEDILKTIYFFMTAGLLTEKSEYIHESHGETVLISEKDGSDNIELFNENTESDDLDKLVFDSPGTPDDKYTLGEKKITDENNPENGIIIDDKSVPGKKDFSLTDQLLQEMKKEDGKKKGKLINVILILVLLSLIITGLIFLLLSPEERAKLIPGSGKKSKVTEISEKGVRSKVDKIESGAKEKKFPVKKKKDVENLKTGTPRDDRSGKSPEKKRIEVKTGKKPRMEIEDPYVPFRKGKLKESGNIWERIIISQNKKYSILLELDCMRVSVLNAYKKTDNDEKFFILNIDRGNRDCYLVLFGTYFSKEEAEKALKSVPGYFWKQTNPPKVIHLNNYL